MDSHHPEKSRWINAKTVSLSIVGILIAAVTTLVTIANRTPVVVRSSALVSYTDQNGLIGSDNYQLFPSPSGATEMFDDLLKDAKEYREFAPCFDGQGQRVGEKAAMLWQSPPPNIAFGWRIIWTKRQVDRSELFWVEATTLEGARAMEIRVREKWQLCRTSH